MSKIAVIGSGFSGLSAAAYLSADGHEVHVFEKNETAVSK
jgi:phytoene desaturase